MRAIGVTFNQLKKVFILETTIVVFISSFLGSLVGVIISVYQDALEIRLGAYPGALRVRSLHLDAACPGMVGGCGKDC